MEGNSSGKDAKGKSLRGGELFKERKIYGCGLVAASTN